MERQDPRRGHRREDRSQRDRSGRGYEGSSEDLDRDQFGNDRQRDEHGSRERYGESGRGRESWRDRPDIEPEHRREGSKEFGSSDYGLRDRDYGSRGQGGSDEEYRRDREGERYGRGGADERSSYSPDWSQQGAEPRYSEDRYYARNRGYGQRSNEYARGASGEWRGDENRTTTAEQRARGFTPREQWGDREQGERFSGQQRSGRETERHRDDEQESHYRGYYSREVRPFSYPGGSGALYMESWTLSGPYSGRGPKGYKRSDQQIIEEACQRLERDGQIDATEIEVTSDDGVIKLRGTVPERSMKRRAEECVESIYGATDVMNELRVSKQGEETGSSSQSSRASQRSQGSRRVAGVDELGVVDGFHGPDGLRCNGRRLVNLAGAVCRGQEVAEALGESQSLPMAGRRGHVRAGRGYSSPAN